ncbi:DinB family protein [Pontibacter saemangeumensis]|uniref:DinB family protein n=1 Tax=Pontibacter saemangeumensis TaxID=1084525 RepID=A0ABP8LJ30_9BACT
MHLIITQPEATEHNSFFSTYVTLAQTNDLIEGLTASSVYSMGMLEGLSEEQLLYRYAKGKWSIKEVMVHLMDTERIFAYRALRFARGDKTELPGFEQDLYINPSQADARPVNDVLAEYIAVRNATIALFKSFSEEALMQTGIGSGIKMSVRALGFAILGHEVHHLKIIRERYLASRGNGLLDNRNAYI